MALIKAGEVVTSDPWALIQDDQPLPEQGDVALSFERLVAGGAALDSYRGCLGVVLAPEDDVQELAAILPRLELVVVTFPKFADGRGYSQARLLRDRLAYKKELRARGDVLADQLYLMQRCGIDAFELKPGKSVENALKALKDLSVAYQGASDDPRPIYRRERA